MATYYINADTGNDSTGDGSSGNPWLLMSYAYGQSSANDTIVAQDSTASYLHANITFTTAITLQGESTDGSGAVFDAGITNVSWTFQASATVEKMTFTNQNMTANLSGILRINSANDVILDINNVVIRDLNIVGAGTARAGCVGITGSGDIRDTINLTNCRFSGITDTGGTSASGIFTFRADSATNSINLYGCTIYDQTGSGLRGIVGSQGATSTPFIIKNTIIQSVDGVEMTFPTTSDPVYAATYSDFNNITDSPTGTGVITSDPLFVDAVNDNFNLRPTSPAINTGTLT